MNNSTKGQVLLKLQKEVTIFTIPKLLCFKVSEIKEKGFEYISSQISEKLGSDLIIVRSSASDEDQAGASNAGAYESITNVNPTNTEALGEAISLIVRSYEKDRSVNERDEIIFQVLIKDPLISGVVFTHDLSTGAPYYVINYDDITGKTDTVTAGDTEYSNRTLCIHRNSTQKLRSKRFIPILNAIQELENVLEDTFLDIEFALSKDLTPILFQVRKITTQPFWNRSVTKKIDSYLDGIKSLTDRYFHGEYLTHKTILAQMPDWNPAEMIGRAPHALAYSLYHELITKDSWRIARSLMGYRNPIGKSLMLSLCGQPYIDVRQSFESYIPCEVPENVANKLICIWLQKLASHPELHDKVEFEVAITAFNFSIDKTLNSNEYDILSQEEKKEYQQVLEKHLQNIIDSQHIGSLKKACDAIKEINSLSESDYQVSDIPMLIETCKNVGIINFAIIARHAFIAKSLLDSLVESKYLSVSDVAAFQASLNTVAKRISKDVKRTCAGEITIDSFFKSYGHLRPGTYNILSPSYRELDHEQIFNQEIVETTEHINTFSLEKNRHENLELLLNSHNIGIKTPKSLFDYCKEAIEAREEAKFIFTKLVSIILDKVKQLAEDNLLSLEEVSHIPITSLTQTFTDSVDGSVEDFLRDISLTNQQKHVATSAIRLPQVLMDTAGIFIVPFQVSSPNFITNKSVTSQTIFIDGSSFDYDISDKIVLIEGADPGYDWIFSHAVRGLITKYGGANSHMAIRCAEFAIPAAIGCGEQRFDQYLAHSKLTLDCLGRTIHCLH